MYTWGLSYMLCDCLFFGSMTVFICAYQFVFMHVHVHACACVRLCVRVAASYGPSGLRVCLLEHQVSMCPRTPLFLVLQRPWTACVCVSVCVCIALQEEAQTALVKVIMNCVCVRGVVFTCVFWPLTSLILWELQQWGGKDWSVGVRQSLEGSVCVCLCLCLYEV